MRILYLIPLLLLMNFGYSQNLIPRIGLSLARTSKSAKDSEFHYKTEKFQPGVLVGLGYEFRLNQTLKVYSEVGYIKKGQNSSWTSKNPNIPYADNRRYSLNFLEVPILLKWEIDIGTVRLHPLVGATFSYGLGGKMEYYFELSDSKGGTISYTGNYDIAFEKKDEHTSNGKMFVGSPLDVGIQAGVGLQMFKKLIVDVRYTHGLKGFEYFALDSDKNRVLEFSVSRPINF